MTKNDKDLRDSPVQLWIRHYRIKRSLEFIKRYDAQKSWKKLEAKIRNRKRIHRKTLLYASSAVAASLLAVFTLVYLQENRKEKKEFTSPVPLAGAFPEVGGRKAILTLHTGKKIDLAELKEEYIVSGNDTLLRVNPGESLTYKQDRSAEGEAQRYNSLTVPRGGEYHLVLSDGTKVWLNAESRLSYPVSFSHTREVTLTGEAYFEVAQEQRTFIIDLGAGRRVEVLGTKFNVSAYDDPYICATLAEGKLKVANADSFVILAPDQQAIAGASGKIETKTVDASNFISWAQGIYQFKKTELSEIMAQLSRWYDVDISFADEHLKHKLFTGVILRYNKLGFAIETIEKISDVKFIEENNTIRITNRQ